MPWRLRLFVGNSTPHQRMSDYRYVAPFYNFLARTAFGHTLHDAKKHYVHRVPPGSRVLMLGGGSGDALNTIAAVSGVRIDFIEPCNAMITRARRLLSASNAHRVTFALADHLVLSDKELYDVAITSFLIDGFNSAEAPAVMHRVFESLKPGGLWLLSDFFDTGKFKRERSPIGFVFENELESESLKTLYFPSLTDETEYITTKKANRRVIKSA